MNNFKASLVVEPETEIWGAYDVNTWYYDQEDGGGTKDNKVLLAADVDVDRLRNHINEYFAQKKVIDFYRNNHYIIPDGKFVSNSGSGSGGGVYVTRCIELHKLPTKLKQW